MTPATVALTIILTVAFGIIAPLLGLDWDREVWTFFGPTWGGFVLVCVAYLVAAGALTALDSSARAKAMRTRR